MTEGDVVLALIETSQGIQKARPGVVLRLMPPFGDALICGVSSKLRQEVSGFDERITPSDSDYSGSGLRVPSLIRLGYLVMKSNDQIIKHLGRVSESRRSRLVDRLCQYIVRPPNRRGDASIASHVPHARIGDLKSYLSSSVEFIDALLQSLIPGADVRPATLHKAMRHSVFAGGKRLRPILCMAAAEACGGSKEAAGFAACAVECLHTYSLIHDDLPCMDDDDFRRGVPTCHKVYGEGVAVLAGDALQALAFELVAKTPITVRYSAADLVRELALTAGSLHLVGGQVADLEGEGQKLPMDSLRYIHESKTAALLTTSIKLGAMSADATEEQLAALHRFGMATGLAFQVIDDILDVTQTSEKLGKSAGKDVAAEKSTFPALIGLDASREEARRLTAEAHAALEIFGAAGQRLRELADYLLLREY